MPIDLDEAKIERNELGLWLAWTLATAAGMVLGYLPAALFVQNLDLGAARIVVPLLAGALLGLAQWLVLRRYVTRSHDWIINLAGGWIVGYTMGLFVVQAFASVPLGGLLGFVLFGVIVALFQWPVLRREIPQLFPWIVANVVGWTLGAFLSQLAAGPLFEARQVPLLASTLATVGITGLVGGAVTGAVLVWIVRAPEAPDRRSHAHKRGG